MKFRKKPVIVEAEQFRCGAETWPAGVERVVDNSANVPSVEYRVKGAQGYVECFENDWIIQEFDGSGAYPCRPDIFEATYEPV